MFKNKTLLITGGTGSFGKAVLNRFANSNLKEIRVFSRDEKKQDDLRRCLNNPKVKYYIGDVRDRQAVENVAMGVDFIFSAAALKQVPTCEFFPMEAFQTNVLGVENVLVAAEKYHVKKVIVLSTDKAVYPINAMGLSKAMMEKVMVARSRNLDVTKSVFCGTRYGNVMASRGSVIPLFVKQIKNGDSITITNPQMTRFMMTMEDAIDLVLYAFEHCSTGDIFVQKASAATIEVLVQALKELYKVDNQIKIIGARHGEKLYETLVNREEMLNAQDMGNYFRIPADNRDLNYDSYFSVGEIGLKDVEEYHSNNTYRLNIEETKQLLLKLPFIIKDLKGEN